MEKENQKKNRIKRFIPELLAPAGNKEAFIAAVEAGADAIYLGGEFFNARMAADNFSLEEISEAVDFAHKRLVKVHVTLNTLLKDEEIPEALSYAEKLWEIGVDALIVQDLGLAHLIRKNIPELSLHLSTQGSVYSLEGVKAALDLGFSRVVLARELSLDEIEKICSGTSGEIEVFVHGALCYCYSGQCQLSRAIGGRSANRGACAQPCRMRYDGAEMPYPLSPRDLDAIDYLDALSEVGVSSLKIEGRMKSSEYVSVVTSIYRKYLDELRDKGAYQVSAEDRLALLQVFSRGFTDNHLSGKEDDDLMSGYSPKNQGVAIGEVVATLPVSKGRTDRFYIDIELDHDGRAARELFDFARGDLLEVTFDDRRISFPVTYIEDIPSWNGKGREGACGLIRVGDIKVDVPPGSKVNRLVSSELSKSVFRFFKNKDWNDGKYIRRTGLNLDITTTGDGYLKATFKEPVNGYVTEVKSGPFAAGVDGADWEGRVHSSFGKTKSTPFDITSIKFHGAGNLNVPMKVLNDIRRKGLALMEEKFELRRDAVELSFDGKASPDGSLPEIEIYLYSIKEGDMNLVKELVSIANKEDVEAKVVFPACEIEALIRGKYIEELEKENLSVKFLPYISNLSKGMEESLLAEAAVSLKEYCSRSDTPIYIGNIGQEKLLREMNLGSIELLSDFGLNIYNGYAEAATSEIGISFGVPSLEIDDYHFGAAPLMVMEHDAKGEFIVDAKGNRFKLFKPDYSDQTRMVRESHSVLECFLSAIESAKESKSKKRFYL